MSGAAVPTAEQGGVRARATTSLFFLSFLLPNSYRLLYILCL